MAEQGAERAPNGKQNVGVSEVDRDFELRRIGAIEPQNGPIAAIYGYTSRADLGKELVREILIELTGRTRLEGHCRDVPGGEAIFEIGHAEAGDRRHKDQHLADHHKEDGEDQETG